MHTPNVGIRYGWCSPLHLALFKPAARPYVDYEKQVGSAFMMHPAVQHAREYCVSGKLYGKLKEEREASRAQLVQSPNGAAGGKRPGSIEGGGGSSAGAAGVVTNDSDGEGGSTGGTGGNSHGLTLTRYVILFKPINN